MRAEQGRTNQIVPCARRRGRSIEGNPKFAPLRRHASAFLGSARSFIKGKARWLRCSYLFADMRRHGTSPRSQDSVHRTLWSHRPKRDRGPQIRARERQTHSNQLFCAPISLFQSTFRKIGEHVPQSCVCRTRARSDPTATMPHQAQRLTASCTKVRRGWSEWKGARRGFAMPTPEAYRASGGLNNCYHPSSSTRTLRFIPSSESTMKSNLVVERFFN